MEEDFELQERFGIPGVLRFERKASGLVRAVVSSKAAEAAIYLQGAHIAHWQPAGQKPVLFLSGKSAFEPGKAIRGGVPIVFPWFGARMAEAGGGRTDGPSHGFARIEEWKLAFAAMAGEDLHLTFTLAPSELSRSLGYDNFRVAYAVTIGSSLTMELTVANDAAKPLNVEEALHTYLAVGDVREVSVTGLEGTTYLDKTDGMKRKQQPEEPLRFAKTTDQVHVDTRSACLVQDVANGRVIVVEKRNSDTTVVWNPWAEATAALADMEPDAWPGMLCIETANVGENAVSIATGESHSMQAKIMVR